MAPVHLNSHLTTSSALIALFTLSNHFHITSQAQTCSFNPSEVSVFNCRFEGGAALKIWLEVVQTGEALERDP